MAGFVSSLLGATGMTAFHRDSRLEYIDEEAAIGGMCTRTQAGSKPKAAFFSVSPVSLVGKTFRFSTPPQAKDGNTNVSNGTSLYTRGNGASVTPIATAHTDSRSFGVWASGEAHHEDQSNVSKYDGAPEVQCGDVGHTHVGPPPQKGPKVFSKVPADAQTRPTGTVTEAEVVQLQATLAAAEAKLAHVQAEKAADAAASAQREHDLMAELDAMTHRAEAAEAEMAAARSKATDLEAKVDQLEQQAANTAKHLPAQPAPVEDEAVPQAPHALVFNSPQFTAQEAPSPPSTGPFFPEAGTVSSINVATPRRDATAPPKAPAAGTLAAAAGHLLPSRVHTGAAAGWTTQLPIGRVASPPASIAAHQNAGTGHGGQAAARPSSPPRFTPAPLARAQVSAPGKTATLAGGWPSAGLLKSMQEQMPVMTTLKMPPPPSAGAGSTFQAARRWLRAPAGRQGFPASPKTPQAGTPHSARAASPAHMESMV